MTSTPAQKWHNGKLTVTTNVFVTSSVPFGMLVYLSEEDDNIRVYRYRPLDILAMRNDNTYALSCDRLRSAAPFAFFASYSS
jgi:hypothetical protein